MKPSEALKNHREQLRDIVARNGATRPRVFGSAIHGDDTDASDLDLLVEPTATTTLMTLAAIQLEAERLLGVRVDVLSLGVCRSSTVPPCFAKRSRYDPRLAASELASEGSFLAKFARILVAGRPSQTGSRAPSTRSTFDSGVTLRRRPAPH
jgi:uncharacterized protein